MLSTVPSIRLIVETTYKGMITITSEEIKAHERITSLRLIHQKVTTQIRTQGCVARKSVPGNAASETLRL